jgi:transketolase
MNDDNIKLDPKPFDTDVEQLPIRKGFGEGLLKAGEEDERVVGLCADLTESTQMHLFRDKFPNRFVQVGIGEQNLAAVGSGMAAMGKIPFITSYAMFSPGRNWEQIRTTICYNDQNVKIAGSHAGVSVGPDGGTHQAIEDIAITRVIPRMTVIVPCDSIEAKKATLAAAKMKGPVYIRLAREKTPVVTTEDTPFEIGKAQVFYTPSKQYDKKVGIVACGGLVYNALRAAKELEEDGIGATVLNLATIKPIDGEALVKLAKENGRIVTVEEHQIAGGVGSAVAEVLAGEYPVPMEFVGVKDLFGQSGTPTELIEHYGMGISHIKDVARKIISK